MPDHQPSPDPAQVAVSLQEGQMQAVEVGQTQVLLVRVEGELRAFQAHCPHHGAPLAEGVLSGTRLVCPWHHACFDLREGTLLEPPALDSLTRYRVRLEGETAWIDPAPQEPPSPAPPAGSDPRTLVIVGGGAAGQAAAEELRRQGFAGRVVLVSVEAELPYDRPHLSKEFLAEGIEAEAQPHSHGGSEPAHSHQEEPPAEGGGHPHPHGHGSLALREEGFYLSLGLELKLGQPVTRLDAQTRQIELGSSEVLFYDAALLATGGVARRLEVPGADLVGVYTLRSLDDARRLVAGAGQAKQVVIIGAGFIGMEAAASLRAGGLEVTVVAPDPVPLKKVLGERVGRALQGLHENHGVRFRLGVKVTGLEGAGRVKAVGLEGGERLPADLVLVGIGIRPATGFVQNLALAPDGSLPVEASLRAAEGLWAAGDIARFPGPQSGEAIRVEHWRVAQQQGRLAARAMLGQAVRYQGVPFFWTEHFGLTLNYVGHAERWEQELFWGDPQGLDFVAFYAQAGRVLAVAGINRDRDLAVPPPGTRCFRAAIGESPRA